MPFQLEVYAHFPFWLTFFKSLGFEVITPLGALKNKKDENLSPCFPAKLVLRQTEKLLDMGVDIIFMPCESYAKGEFMQSNFPECSVYSFFPELLKVLIPRLDEQNFLSPYLDLNNEKSTCKKLANALSSYKIKKSEIKKSLAAACEFYYRCHGEIKSLEKQILITARRERKPVFMLLCRPYYLDAKVNKGIDKILSSFGGAILSEDLLFSNADGLCDNKKTLFRAAMFCCENPDITPIHIISEGCHADNGYAAAFKTLFKRHNIEYFSIAVGEKPRALKTKLKEIFKKITAKK